MRGARRDVGEGGEERDGGEKVDVGVRKRERKRGWWKGGRGRETREERESERVKVQQSNPPSFLILTYEQTHTQTYSQCTIDELG